jgi:type III pantothenate kinase
VLLLDAGNSRCKWALVQDGAWTHRGAAGNGEPDALRQALRSLPPPSLILVSNVAGAAMERQLREICSGWGRPPEFVTACAGQCGVRNSYQRPESLGSDRWAALIAAWQRVHDSCLVVNCGTATTVDALSAQGEFLGGLILPGIGLMQQGLVANTAQLGAEQGVAQDFPLNTADAIHSGALRATAGAIQHQFGLLQARFGAVRCLIGGGAASVILPHLDMPLERVDDLVLHGLQVIGEAKA